MKTSQELITICKISSSHFPVETIRMIFMIVDIPNVETISSNSTVKILCQNPNVDCQCRISKLGCF